MCAPVLPVSITPELGSGIPMILKAYPKESFRFSENFLRITLPTTVSESNAMQDAMQDAMQVTPQVEELLKVFSGTHSRGELQEKLGLLNRDNFRKNYLQPAIEAGLVTLTIPDKPTSGRQKYYLTEKGKALIKL